MIVLRSRLEAKSMETFRDLIIKYDLPGALPELLKHLEAGAAGGWARRPADDSEDSPQDPNSARYFCFAREEGELSPILLWLVTRPRLTLGVANIISRRRDLSRHEYNCLLEDFYRNVVRTSLQHTPFINGTRMTPAEVKIERLLPEQVAVKLKAFSAAANKLTGSSHPADFQRWLDFLTDAHLIKEKLDADTLRRWLKEEEGWPEDTASQLADEYGFASELLGRYERARGQPREQVGSPR